MASDSKIVKSLFRGGSIIFVGMVISKLFSLLYRVIVGRALGPEEYGVISVMLAISSVIGVIAFLGIPNGVQKYVSEYRGTEEKEKQVGLIRTGLLLITLPSIIVAVVVFSLAPWIAIELFNEPRAIWPIRFMALILPFRAYRKIFYRTTDAYEKMRYKVYTNYIYANITNVLLTIILIFFGYGYLGAAFSYAFAWASALLLSTYFAWKVLPEIFTYGKTEKQYSKLFQHSWPLFAAGLIASIAGYIDTFMLQAFLGSEEVGLYNAAYPFAATITFAGSAFGSIYLSNASKLFGEDRKEELIDAYRLTVKWISLLAIPTTAIILGFPQAILQIFGSEYIGMANVLRILALGFLLSALIGPTTKIIQAVDKTLYKLYLTLFIGSSNILLNYLLIPIYGIVGAALATTLTFAFAFILKIIVIKHLTGRQPFRPVIFKIIVSSSIAAIIVYLIAQIFFETSSLWFLTLSLPLYGALYLTLILATRTIEEEDLTVLNYIREKTGINSEKIEKIIRKYS